MFDDNYKGLTLDEAAAEAGGYVVYTPGKKLVMDYDYRELSKQCREKGVEPIDLTEDKLKVFEINPPLVYPRTYSETMSYLPPDDVATSADLVAIAESQKNYKRDETVSHDDINWD